MMADVYRTVAWANLAVDEGNAECHTDELWVAEAELEPDPIDKWARGAIKTKKKSRKQSDLEQMMSLKGAPATTPSESGRSGRTGARRTVRSRQGSTRGVSSVSCLRQQSQL